MADFDAGCRSREHLKEFFNRQGRFCDMAGDESRTQLWSIRCLFPCFKIGVSLLALASKLCDKDNINIARARVATGLDASSLGRDIVWTARSARLLDEASLPIPTPSVIRRNSARSIVRHF